MARKKPFQVAVGGVRRTVTFSGPLFWVADDGAHPGKLLTKLEAPVRVVRKSKVCARCKKPAWTQTSRGRAIHPACEGFLITLPDSVEADLVFRLAASVGASIEYQ